GGATAMALSPDGRTLAAAAASGTVHLWAVTARPPGRYLPLPQGAWDIACLKGDAAIATYSADGLRLWSAETGQLLSRPAGISGQTMYAFSEDGRFLVEGS